MLYLLAAPHDIHAARTTAREFTTRVHTEHPRSDRRTEFAPITYSSAVAHAAHCSHLY
jgi:hypothetical protein